MMCNKANYIDRLYEYIAEKINLKVMFMTLLDVKTVYYTPGIVRFSNGLQLACCILRSAEKEKGCR